MRGASSGRRANKRCDCALRGIGWLAWRVPPSSDTENNNLECLMVSKQSGVFDGIETLGLRSPSIWYLPRCGLA
jgi:hypothetical protein